MKSLVIACMGVLMIASLSMGQDAEEIAAKLKAEAKQHPQPSPAVSSSSVSLGDSSSSSPTPDPTPLVAPTITPSSTPKERSASSSSTSQDQEGSTIVRPKPTPPKRAVAASRLYSGRVHITRCTDDAALGEDRTGRTIVCMPRFRGAHPGMVVGFTDNLVIRETDDAVYVRCEPSLADRSPYNGAANAAAQMLNSGLNVLKTITGH